MDMDESIEEHMNDCNEASVSPQVERFVMPDLNHLSGEDLYELLREQLKEIERLKTVIKESYKIAYESPELRLSSKNSIINSNAEDIIRLDNAMCEVCCILEDEA
jgi:hypothetical protein